MSSLESPIKLVYRRRTAVFGTPLPSIPSWNGIDAIELKDGSPIGFLSHYDPLASDPGYTPRAFWLLLRRCTFIVRKIYCKASGGCIQICESGLGINLFQLHLYFMSGSIPQLNPPCGYKYIKCYPTLLSCFALSTSKSTSLWNHSQCQTLPTSAQV
jgi:hypothetical protein